jgi:hypothetical protein
MAEEGNTMAPFVSLVVAVLVTTGAAPAPDAKRCPLTAEQVSAALGAKVEGPDSACSFFPSKGLTPSAGYTMQMTNFCAGDAAATSMLVDMGYTEKLDGLGVPAHIGDRTSGVTVLVCRSGTPFELRVDVPAGKAKARKAAIALAKQILAAR